MKTQITKIEQQGYGHWLITILFRNGKYYSATTTDSESVDNYKTEKRAKKCLINCVKRTYNLK